MSLTIVLIDTEPSYLRDGGNRGLLALPLGKTSVLEHLIARLRDLVEKSIVVLSAPRNHAALAAASRHSCTMVDGPGLARAMQELEPSDCVLLVQSRYWPTSGYDLAAVRQCLREYHGTSYGVVLGVDPQDARELVDQDSAGRVRRVQRLYNAANWPEVASSMLAYAVVPALALREVQFNSLVDLRTQLSARGMLSTDQPILSETLDLASQGGLLALHERILATDLHLRNAESYQVLGPDVLTAPDCRIHESVRLVPPVLIQRGAVLDRGVTVVGPALIGKDSRVGPGAVVAQALLACETVVSEETVIRHRVVSGTVTQEALKCEARDCTPIPVGRTDRYAELSMPAGGVRRRHLSHYAAKRALDVILASLGLLLLAPLLLVISLLIKLDSPGPVFFAHRRERKGGREFPCIKFRTMVQGAHSRQRELYGNNQVDGPQFKLREDPRVTRLGQWLRATNIDELPQLVNVLLGHMSLVGPRPSPFRENQICVPWRRARLSVRPGITGLWQICRDEDRRADFHQWIYYDIMYVRHFSFWLDVKILLGTVLTLGGKWSIPLNWLIRKRGLESDHPREPLPV